MNEPIANYELFFSIIVKKTKDMKRLKKTALFISTLLFVSLFSACDMYSYVTPSVQVRYDNPSWAPPYVAGVRYYYLPDIEAYYDLSTRQFVYLNDGQWCYSESLPSIYAGFDLDNCFTVAIDINTYQPWMHQHYYVSHYPRYYYRDYYDHSNIPYVRGYNENGRSAIYWGENERNRARRWDNENLKSNRQFKYSDSDRRQQNSNSYNPTRLPTGNNDASRQPDNRYNSNMQPNRENNNAIRTAPSNNGTTNRQPENNRSNTITSPRISVPENGSRPQNAVTPVRTNQNTNYYGRTIGQPVKVEKQMRQRTPVKAPKASVTKNNRDSREQNDTNRR